MPEILFVHGTGVRHDSYNQTLSIVRRQVSRHIGDFTVRTCLWGEEMGAKLHAHGASIPDYLQTSSKQASSNNEVERIEQAAWEMLGKDPLFEIRVLEYLPKTNQLSADPFSESNGENSVEMLENLNPTHEFVTLLQEKGLENFWEDIHLKTANDSELVRILRTVNRDPEEISHALSRTLIAGLIYAAEESGFPPVSVQTRKKLVELLIPLLGGQPLGPFDWITKPLTGLAKQLATNKVRRERRVLSDAAFPSAGDIMLYQTRGEAIRGFIHDCIRESQNDLIIMAHSLGGIAVVDLLIQEDMSDNVKGLVTIGSQAPFLYEINALSTLPFGDPLPIYFPKHWLNIYDPNDFLSYIGSGVFGVAAVKDFRVESGLSFPESHSAYFEQNAVWEEIKDFFQWG